MDVKDPRAAQFKEAVFAKDADELRRLFVEHPQLSEVVDEPWFDFGTPAIVQAAGARDRALVDTLLELGADIDARSKWENGPYSALHRLVDGADGESLALADYLAERGAEIDLHAAAGMGRENVIEEILGREPDRVSEPGPDGATPLHLAKNVEIAGLLLDYGAEIDKRCVDHRSTPAMWAMLGREDVVRFLVENGARPDLYMAVALEDLDLAAEILAAEASAIEVRVFYGHSHEHLGHGDKYTWALGGADTPVELARLRDKKEMYAYLLERSAPSVRLVQASRRGDAAEIERLLGENPELLSQMEDREVCEALYGSPDGASTLLSHGSDPNARDDRAGATALHHAAWRGLRELAEVLLDGGADPYCRDHDYSATPLGWANENGQQDLMDLLLERNPPDIVDAAWMGDADRVRELIDGDPSILEQLDAHEVSPLRSAAWCGKIEVVRLLLERGADPRIPHEKTGKTALDLASERGHEDIVSLLSNTYGGP